MAPAAGYRHLRRLLEVLADYQVTIPEMGTVSATRRPFVVLTSNASRELSEAVKRRCLFLHLDYPDAEREMYGFETLTFSPIDLALVEPAIMTVDEIAWLDAYHARVRELVTPDVDAYLAAHPQVTPAGAPAGE